MIASTSDASGTSIEGTLNSTASTQFALDFFASPTCDALGKGEGQTYLGFTTVTTDGTGNVTFNANRFDR